MESFKLGHNKQIQLEDSHENLATLLLLQHQSVEIQGSQRHVNKQRIEKGKCERLSEVLECTKQAQKV
jgi:hypothetical protein